MKKEIFFIPMCLISVSILIFSGCSPKQEEKMAQNAAAIDTTTWHPLFNGVDLTGWKHVGDGSMYVEDSLIKTKGGMGLLYWAAGPLGNCRIRVTYRMRDENSNSGIFIKVPIEPREAWMPVFYGYEVQIDNHPELSGEDDYHATGGLYSYTRAPVKAWKPGPEYNTQEIIIKGPRVVVFLNGVKVTDFTEGDPVPERKFDFEPFPGPRPDVGWFGLQNHGEHDVVFFKEVTLRYLGEHEKID